MAFVLHHTLHLWLNDTMAKVGRAEPSFIAAGSISNNLIGLVGYPLMDISYFSMLKLKISSSDFFALVIGTSSVPEGFEN